jgi:hypothetical protein
MAVGRDLSEGPPPLVLTLEMDGESFAFFNELRARYYPPERNIVPAHVTLFYRLPGSRRREIKALLAQTASGQRPFAIAAGDVRALERGVAVFLHSPQLHALRDALAVEWWPWLIDRDKAGFRPHVTIQINVSPAEARLTERALAALRMPRVDAVGLHLWCYRDGPWEHEQLFRFR